MIRLAVVGDIGSGKSYVAKQFGYPVFNADAEVAKLYKKSRKCYNKLKKVLPAYIVSFPIKKNEISKAIIASRHNLKKIVKIIHPEVRSNMNIFVRKNKNKKILIFEIPLLVESGLTKNFDTTVFVNSKKKMRLKRYLKKRPKNRKIFNLLDKRQLLPVKKIKFCDYVINNNNSLKKLKKRVKLVQNKL